MSRQNATDGANDSRGPRAAGGSPDDRSPTDGDIATGARTLATLGNDTRSEALRFVAAAGEPVHVREPEPALGLGQRAVSRALSRLFAAGPVERRTNGRWRLHTATPRARRLRRFLDETRTATRADE